ncbi:MAG: GNAT family N-acetyltransferase [bacterium]|nr:GNAT family N-acetyltransferase [bacterium]
MYQFKLIKKADISTIIPLLKILAPKMEEALLNERLEEMTNNHNYECVGVYDGETLIGMSGLWLLNKYYVGKHIEPDNVVIIPAYRGKGIGQQLLNWINEYGKQNGCKASELNCYLNNSEGLKFWLNNGYKVLGVHCQKKFE